MFEKLITILAGFFLSLGGFTTQGKGPTQLAHPSEMSIRPSAIFPGKRVDVSYNNQLYTLWIEEIPSLSTITLIANFTQKENGETIAKNNACAIAINGGYYLAEEKPLGLFYTDGKSYGSEVESTIATGFFWQEKSGKRIIDYQKPQLNESVDFIFQTGPLFPVGDKKLQLIDDENARRSLIVESPDKLYALSLTENENTLLGPYLSDVPIILAQENLKEFQFQRAINLDGGSASFFYATGEGGPFVLSELKSIGSLLCIKSQ